ncbi:hypothetical protein E2C01_004405 [Portunus trituberculatus]|uniref:Uncharacterized protein n=1 Tax=Portunus trituberculatus TaxID=210409 RepID=A0A5B7CSA1_PORTR|nr:hypothetical protein [Portunus trituberculatus]
MEVVSQSVSELTRQSVSQSVSEDLHNKKQRKEEVIRNAPDCSLNRERPEVVLGEHIPVTQRLAPGDCLPRPDTLREH